MKKLLAVIPFLFVLVACPSSICTVVQSVANSAATVVSTACTCANPTAMATDLAEALTGAGGCAATEGKDAGTISGILCPMIGTVLATAIAQNKIFTDGQCTGAITCVATAIQPMIAACQLLPFAPNPKR